MARWIGGVIVVAAVGCGSGGPGPGDVTLTVYRGGDPVAGAPVWFSDPDTGEPIAEGTTDDAGFIYRTVPAGSAVTAAVTEPESDPADWIIYTITGTQPGDQLTAGSATKLESEQLGAFEVNVPGPFTGAAYYEISIGCRATALGDPTLTALVLVSTGCLDEQGKVALYARAFDGGGAAIAFTPLVLLDPPPTSEIVPASLDAWRTDFSSFDLTALAVPDGTAEVASGLTFFRGGPGFESGQQQETMPAAGTVAHGYGYPPEGVGRLFWQLQVVDATQDNAQLLVGSAASPDLPAGDTLDLDDGLPTLTQATGAIAPGGSPALACQASADPAVADGAYGFAQWTNPNGSRVLWYVFAPADQVTALAYPLMPDSMRLYRGVQATETRTGIYLVSADHFDGYADFRAGAGQLFDRGTPTFDLHVRMSAATTTSAF